MKKLLLSLLVAVMSVTAWAADLVVTYDFSSTKNYPSGFPTDSKNTCTTETGYVFNGNTIYFKTANSGSLYQASTGSGASKVYSVFLGKNVKYNASSANTIASTAYMKIPGKTGYKISKIVVTNASNAATSGISLAVCNANYQMVISEAVASSTSADMTFSINTSGTTLAENEAAYFCMAPTVAAGKNLNVKKIVVTYSEAAVATPYTVTFNAGTNGTCSTSSLTEASAGAGVTLPSCTANTGYKFMGWTATEGNATIDAGLTAGSTYKPSANTTLYAVYGALYKVTIEEPTNGTLTVTCGGAAVTSGDYYAVGERINIVATPSDGYKFRNIQVVDGSTRTFTASNVKEWTMADHAITIKANFDEIVYRTITWSVNGNTSEIAPSQFEDGTNITFPTGLDIYGKTFVGWSANSAATDAGDLVSGNVAASADATYYAVFADVSEGDDFEITLNYQNVHTTYTTDGVDRDMQTVTGFKYYGCCQGKESGSNVYSILQMRKISNNETTSWIYNNTSIDIKDVKITYTSSNNKLCDVYFGNTANPTTGATSCDGTANAAGENTFTNTEGYKYFRIDNPKNGAIYISSIVVTCSNISYSNYTTTVSPRQINPSTNANGLGTFSCAYPVEIPATVECYKANVDGSTINLTKIDSNVLPANTGVLLNSIEGNSHSFVEVADGGVAVTENDFVATSAYPTVASTSSFGSYVYGMSTVGSETAFRPFSGETFAANKAVLVLVVQAAGSLRIVFDEEEGSGTGIENVEAQKNVTRFFDLNGREVINPSNGIFICNGKKMIIK
ncbi:MAG: InlB B-repeat-containing protein [Bacteroidales bacterium]|nr:InlB B-repeat-containing protein [Candidatus Liminaster caballi]